MGLGGCPRVGGAGQGRKGIGGADSGGQSLWIFCCNDQSRTRGEVTAQPVSLCSETTRLHGPILFFRVFQRTKPNTRVLLQESLLP